MIEENNEIIPHVIVKDNILIKVNQSIQIANKILKENESRKLVPQIKTIVIGDQEWMAENLNIMHFRNGDLISEVKDYKLWEESAEKKIPCWCYYNNDPRYAQGYGKIYNWAAVNDSRGLAPLGWHIPTGEEWKKLIKFLGKTSGIKMKSESGWTNDHFTDENLIRRKIRKLKVNKKEYIATKKNGWNGNNKSLFNGLAGGERLSTGVYENFGSCGMWWSSDPSSYDRLTCWYDENERGDLPLTIYLPNYVIFSLYFDEARGLVERTNSSGFYVRCIKD